MSTTTPARSSTPPTKKFLLPISKIHQRQQVFSNYVNEIPIPIPRLRHLAGEIHGLGDRALYELFRELNDGADFGDTLERYGALAPLRGFIAQLDGDRLPPPVRLVGRAGR